MGTEAKQYDVAICGAGMAGLTLARQLRLQMPEVSVLMLDKSPRPLPEAGFKVGESTVIIGAAYLQNVVGLKDYLVASHIPKLGLRYFFPSSGSFATRPEMGRGRYDDHTTEWQIDRGIFENDLRQMVVDDGVELLEGAAVTDIRLSDDGMPHQVDFTLAGDDRSARASWIIDATGRRRFLQKKLGLARKAQGSPCSAAWFRVKGRIDVRDLVPDSEERWHGRVPGDHPEIEDYGRYNSTNHLMGPGYWVWLIPLSSGHTSVGIVALDELHPFASYNTHARAMDWLKKHEPELAKLVDVEPLDFRVLQRYSFSSERVFSHERWACTGEAGAFPDPFYSPGTDSIAFTNCVISELIAQDRKGRLSAKMCDEVNTEYLSWVNNTTASIQSGYRYWGDPVVGAMKIVWDFNNFRLSGPRFYSMLYRPGFLDSREWMSAELGQELEGMLALRQVVSQLFRDWIRENKRRASFEWIDYFGDLDFIYQGARTISTPKTTPLPDLQAGCARLEEVAQALFLIAVEDTMPEELGRFRNGTRARWLNAWAIGLDRDRWEERGLFRPKGEGREHELNIAYGELRRALRFDDNR